MNVKPPDTFSTAPTPASGSDDGGTGEDARAHPIAASATRPQARRRRYGCHVLKGKMNFTPCLVLAAFLCGCASGSASLLSGEGGAPLGNGPTDKPGGGGACPAVGSKACANDQPFSQFDSDACMKAKADPSCGTQYTDFVSCALAHVSCTADGKVDSSRILANCQVNLDAYTRCVMPGVRDGG